MRVYAVHLTGINGLSQTFRGLSAKEAYDVIQQHKAKGWNIEIREYDTSYRGVIDISELDAAAKKTE